MANEKRAHTDPAHVLAMVELINNDNERIDWDYWAGKMPRWTTYQAVRLMAALDPAKHPDLSFKRNETAGAAKEQAKRLELLAASHGKTEASPRDWLKWADDLHESVHEGCRIAIENLTSVRRVPRVSKAPAPIITPLPGGSSGTFLSWNTAKRRQSSDRPPRWSKWRLMPEVRVWEAVALSLGIEPEQVAANRNAWMGAKYPFDEDNEFTDRLDVTIANVHDRNRFPTPCAINMGNAYLNGVRLSEFARFAIELAQWDMPDELQALAAIGPAAQQQSAAPNATPAATPIVPTTAPGAMSPSVHLTELAALWSKESKSDAATVAGDLGRFFAAAQIAEGALWVADSLSGKKATPGPNRDEVARHFSHGATFTASTPIF